jgi:hypothetical protein
VLAGAPLLFAAVLLAHPAADAGFADVVAAHRSRWLLVHVGELVCIGLLALALLRVLRELPGRAARIARLAVVPFVVLGGAWSAVQGAAGVVITRSGAEAAQALGSSPLVGDVSVLAFVAGALWVSVAVGAALALRESGASMLASALVGSGALLVAHLPPVGPLALAAMALGIALAAPAWDPRAAAEPVPPAPAATAPDAPPAGLPLAA